VQDDANANDVLGLVHSWKHARLQELDSELLWDETYLGETGSLEVPRGLDLLDQMPSEKYRDKLQYVWDWCKGLATQQAMSSRPAVQPSSSPSTRPAQKARPKPPG
jgi:hypothetical protein